MISVLDYGAGNVGSVIRMIERAGGTAQRIASPEEVLAARKLVIPGVGAFNHGMAQLTSRKLLTALSSSALEARIPILGICLGMQLMCRSSEEGALPGLGWIDAEVRRFPASEARELRVPHMGWNTLRVLRENPLVSSDDEEQRFYFVHSYRVSCNDSADPIALTHYGDDFVAAFQRNNIFGVQFHPEKSHRFGMALMRRFVEFEVA
ncbi:MAG: imidazole glycerol phosphate synthase subunit HisH [Polaromonas sp.]|uniref:imidazole glycerol phosphate synthase subunit HisH n=1 Tax=Polaromonas sp. TaxID=1869339 RepID=UPI002732FC8F|nr:imidazole glycerol phosphate synthase subunit HisH [Polaromonas sp.]MDP2820540.1 imidazole glycerol phosphate synthase subunit HisH [Polaromonas sp.]